MTVDLEDCLVVAVSSCDVQAVLSLLSSGACVNIPGPDGDQPLLQTALTSCSHSDESHVMALSQLLLLNGADPNSCDLSGRSAVDLVKDRRELLDLLVDWGADPPPGYCRPDNSTRFHQYVFHQEEEVQQENLTSVPTPKRAKEFLEQVADIFKGELEGVSDAHSMSTVTASGDSEFSSVLSQLDNIGFGTPVKVISSNGYHSSESFRHSSGLSSSDSSLMSYKCSTPSSKGRYLNISQMSEILPQTRPHTTPISLKYRPPSTPNRSQSTIKESTFRTPSNPTFNMSTQRLLSTPNISKCRPPSKCVSVTKESTTPLLTVTTTPSNWAGRETTSSLARRRTKHQVIDSGDLDCFITPKHKKQRVKKLKYETGDNSVLIIKSPSLNITESVSDGTFRSCQSEVEIVAQALANNSLLSMCQEFIIKEGDVSLVELRMPSVLGMALQDQELLEQLHVKSEQVVSETSLSLSGGVDSLPTMELRDGLEQFGEPITGPITAQTKRSYLLRLKRLRLGLAVPHSSIDSSYPGPMAGCLKNVSSVTRNWTQLLELEQNMSKQFNVAPDIARQVNMLTRETACKSSFNYLLLDPRKTQNLPLKVFSRDDQELWRTFVSAVFYIGKGSRSRPFQHLYDAVKQLTTKAKKGPSDKIAKIHSIWEEGAGVVAIQVFHNTIAVEAYTREAAMLDAMGCDNLTNEKGGDFYGPAADWDQETRQKLGTFLLFKAFKIFLQEGERQIRPVDLRT